MEKRTCNDGFNITSSMFRGYYLSFKGLDLIDLSLLSRKWNWLVWSVHDLWRLGFRFASMNANIFQHRWNVRWKWLLNGNWLIRFQVASETLQHLSFLNFIYILFLFLGLLCCLTSTEAGWPIRDGDRVGRGTGWLARPRIPPEKDRRDRRPPPEQWKC